MKRLFAGLLTLALLLTLSACDVRSAFTKYTATFTVYVDCSDGLDSVASFSMDRILSEQYEETFIIIMKSQSVLESIIEQTGVSLTTDQLAEMISAQMSENTSIMTVRVTAEDSQMALSIAQALAEAMPSKVAQIVSGVSLRIDNNPYVSANTSLWNLFR